MGLAGFGITAAVHVFIALVFWFGFGILLSGFTYELAMTTSTIVGLIRPMITSLFYQRQNKKEIFIFLLKIKNKKWDQLKK